MGVSKGVTLRGILSNPAIQKFIYRFILMIGNLILKKKIPSLKSASGKHFSAFTKSQKCLSKFWKIPETKKNMGYKTFRRTIFFHSRDELSFEANNSKKTIKKMQLS